MMTTSQASSPHSVLHPIPLARDRWDDCRGPGSLPEGALAHNPRPVTRRHLQAAAGAARRDTEGIGRPAAAWDSDAVGIMHLIQFALGMLNGDDLSWRPIFASLDRQRRRL